MTELLNSIDQRLKRWEKRSFFRLFSMISLSLLCYSGAEMTSLVHVKKEFPSDNDFINIGYLPDYRFNSVKESAIKNLSDVIYYSVRINTDGTLQKRTLPSRSRINKLKSWKQKYGVRYHLSVGGGLRSEGFKEVTASAVKRKILIDELLLFCIRYGFAGVDFDWEFPANSREKENYNKLLVETAKEFDKRYLKVSAAINGSQFMSDEVFQHISRIHLMAYDDLGRHATFDRAVKYSQALIDRGCPEGKLVLGLPLYGKHVKTRKVMSASEILRYYKPKEEVDEVKGMYFNNISTIKRKKMYAKNKGLGGIMYWEVTLAPEHFLEMIETGD